VTAGWLLLLVACGSGPWSWLPGGGGSATTFTRWELARSERVDTTPTPTAIGPEGELLRSVLVRIVADHAIDAENPWALTHALVALGPNASLPDGTLVVDHLFTRWADVVSVPGGEGVRFPAKLGAVRIEPHTDLVLKSVTEVGVRPDRLVTVNGEERPLSDLYWGSVDRAWVDGDEVSFDGWNDTPWALRGLAAWAPPHQAHWNTSDGRSMDLDRFTDAVVARLVDEQQFLVEAAARGRSVPKRGQFIYGYTCGGAHLFQGAAYAVARGHGSQASREALQAQIPILFFRLHDELAQVDAAMRADPSLAPVLLVQRMKFLGHWLESVHSAAAMGLFSPDERQVKDLEFARDQLLVTVSAEAQLHMFERVPELWKIDEQLTLDLIGDSAHALRGLDLATGRVGIRY